jgi:NADH-quinone oxidoreductase subunit N
LPTHALVPHARQDSSSTKKRPPSESTTRAFLRSGWPPAAFVYALTLFLLALIGVPPTGGFFGKFYIFKAALDANLVWLTVLGLLNSAVAAFYYLRLMVNMYMRQPAEDGPAPGALPLGLKAAVGASALGIVALGLFPQWVLGFATWSARQLR